MKILRLFSTEQVKGQRNYLNSQKKYEIIRTILYFSVSLSLFLAGRFSTGTRENLLTVVAILGCLPASKSMVSMIMFLRFSSLPPEKADVIEAHMHHLCGLFDLVITTEKKNYRIGHIVSRENVLCGYTEDPAFDEKGFYTYIDQVLKAEHYKNITVKVFTDLKKYTDRLDSLEKLSEDASEQSDTKASGDMHSASDPAAAEHAPLTDLTPGILACLKSVSL